MLARIAPREALVRQTASAEILRVVSETQDDLTPVFNAILSRAAMTIGFVVAALLVEEILGSATWAGASTAAPAAAVRGR